MTRIFINGRFVAQNLSGVQRFATEITAALRDAPAFTAQLLAPQNSPRAEQNIVRVGRLSGQAWEQIELPRHAKGGLLVNLGNTAPIFSGRQLLVIHDTGVFSTPNAYSWKFRAWYKFMQRAVIRQGAKIVTVSKFSRTQIVQHLGLREKDVAVVPEGADHMQRMTAFEDILGEHGLLRGRFVLAVGNLSSHKNLPALGALARRLDERGIPLLITGGLGGAAFHASGATQLPRPAIYAGRVRDEALKALYQSAGCFVFPSLYEGFGLPVVEAMACGCPVVAADIPALHEAGGAAALFCDPNSPEDIAAKVLEVLNDQGLAARLREAGLEHTKAMTWQRAAQALAEVITACSERRA